MKNIKCLLTILMLLSSNLIFSGITISKFVIDRRSIALIRAVRCSLFEEAEKLIDSCTINIKDSFEMTPLMIATQHNNKKMVEFLIKKGAKLDMQNDLGCTALLLVCYSGNADIAELLLKSGANPDIKQHSQKAALMVAARDGYIEIVKLLIKFRANTFKVDDIGWTVLEFAKSSEEKEIIELLEQTRDNLIKKVKESILKLNESKDAQEEKLAKIKIKQLLKRYSDQVDFGGNTILHYAAMMNAGKAFNYIWNIRPDLFNKKNNLGQVPVDLNPQIIMHLHYLKLIGPK